LWIAICNGDDAYREKLLALVRETVTPYKDAVTAYAICLT
jgi:hypothetical protein